MIDPTTASAAPQEKPWVTLSYDDKGAETIQTNVPPTGRPILLWMLERTKQIILNQLSEEEKSKLVKPQGNGVAGMLRRMGKA